jgi:hypothetical protein
VCSSMRRSERPKAGHGCEGLDHQGPNIQPCAAKSRLSEKALARSSVSLTSLTACLNLAGRRSPSRFSSTAYRRRSKRPLSSPVPYLHPSGAVTWVSLDPSVTQPIARARQGSRAEQGLATSRAVLPPTPLRPAKASIIPDAAEQEPRPVPSGSNAEPPQTSLQRRRADAGINKPSLCLFDGPKGQDGHWATSRYD